jgi:hypothetical protein
VKGWLDANSFVVIVVVFVLFVLHAVFISVARWESEKHTFGPVTGHEKRFGRMRGWL